MLQKKIMMKNSRLKFSEYMQNISIGWCIKFATGVEMEIFAVYVITFEPIRIQTCSSPQNDRLNLSFVKDFHVVGKKMTKNGQKMAIFESSIFRIFFFKNWKSGNRKNCDLWCNLWSNWDLDRSSTPKMTVWSYFLWNMFMWLPKKWPEMVVKWATHTVVAFICTQSIYIL